MPGGGHYAGLEGPGGPREEVPGSAGQRDSTGMARDPALLKTSDVRGAPPAAPRPCVSLSSASSALPRGRSLFRPDSTRVWRAWAAAPTRLPLDIPRPECGRCCRVCGAYFEVPWWLSTRKGCDAAHSRTFPRLPGGRRAGRARLRRRGKARGPGPALPSCRRVGLPCAGAPHRGGAARAQPGEGGRGSAFAAAPRPRRGSSRGFPEHGGGSPGKRPQAPSFD